LTSEIFQRTLEHWRAGGGSRPCTIYDPVCGGAYWLTVLAYLHRSSIASILASDIDTDMLPYAESNLSLISLHGLDRRITEIEAMLAAYHKESHTEALVSAKKFREQLSSDLKSNSIAWQVFQADAMNSENMARGLKGERVDLVLADIPYGWQSKWQGNVLQSGTQGGMQKPLWQMLEALRVILKPGAVVAIASDKRQKIKHNKFHRLERFQVGKRRISILQPQ
jgi:tRNA G10  N-methylase Trm11